LANATAFALALAVFVWWEFLGAGEEWLK